jgi:hypothetical protein
MTAATQRLTDCLHTREHQCTTQTVNAVSYEGTPDTITTGVAGGNSACYWKFEVSDESTPRQLYEL